MLSSKDKASIDQYQNEINHIEGSINQIRTRPTMYIGALGEYALLTMFREIFQNSIDQLLYKNSPCDFIKVIFDERDNYSFTVFDNGLGIPYDYLIDIFTVSHTGKNLKEKKLGDYSSGLNGIGAKATNALSEHFDVWSYRYDGTCKHVSFYQGEVKSEEILDNPQKIQGTQISFSPDHTILGETPINPSDVYLLIKHTIYLLPLGSKIDYTRIDKRNQIVYHEEMVNENGIESILNTKFKTDKEILIRPIRVYKDNGNMKIDACFSFSTETLFGEDIVAYANTCPTTSANSGKDSDNTHVVGVLSGITSWFKTNMNKTYLNDPKKKVIDADIKLGLKLVISAWHLNPEFTGQSKEKMSNKDFAPFAKEAVMEALDKWSKEWSTEYLKVCKYLKDIMTARLKSETEKEKITAKYAVSPSSGLPQKYVKPSNKNSKNLELFIVEGDSACGSARSARNVENQGIFPIRGKILSVWQATTQKIMANAEIMGIAQILGAGYGKNFDVSKVKFSKIIFMTDADSDGSHIANLLLSMCLRVFPGLVESGKVYKAIPPLYGIPVGKSRMQYFAERKDYVKYMQQQFYKKNTVSDISGNPISPKDFSSLLIENSDYIYDFSIISERYKVNPILLEIVLSSHILGESFEQLRKRIVSEFRFMTNDSVTRVNSSVIQIKGLINGRIETIFYDERFLRDCSALLEPMKTALRKHGLRFLVNNVKVGLYDLVSMAMNSLSSVSRFKGLGEMNPDQLAESTMNPETRVLIQYTADDAGMYIQTIRQYDEDKKLVFQHVDSIDRSDLIGI